MDIIKARQQLLIGKTIYDMKLKVADYGRVSTDKDDQLNSLENQVNYFSDMISGVKNWTHVKSYVDEGISGTQVNKRDQFLKMIEDAKLGKIDLILTKEVSRFARNTVDSIEYTELLLKYGVIVFFISDNINTIYPDSEFRLTLMASMAQDEVRKLSERVKFGIKRSIKDGKLGGSSLTGYDKKNGKLIINEQEAPIVRILFSLYASGQYGFSKIAKILKDKGYYTKRGKQFSTTTLKKMLKNYRYKGYYTANLSTVENYKTHRKKINPKDEWIIYKDKTGNVPAIISEELWDRANKIYNERNNIWNKNVLNKEFYLENRTYTSKLICKEHNTSFIRSASCKRKNNPVWQCNYYLRHGLDGCKTPIIYEKYLNIVFTNIIENIIGNKENLIKSIINDYKNLITENNDENNLNKKIAEQNNFKDKLLDMLLQGLISNEEYKLKKEDIDNNIKKLMNQTKVKVTSSKYIISINKTLKHKMDIKDNIGKYFNLFIDKVFISKINNNRKHIKLEILYNFKKTTEFVEINMDNNKIKNISVNMY